MTYVLLAIAVIYCAYQVMRAKRLLNVTIWLAIVSALVSIQLYLLGAPEVAVMELSVGAGLVTVLFVYAFSIVGEATVDERTTLPRALIWVMILGVSFLLGWFVLPGLPQAGPAAAGNTFAQVLWGQRGLDVIAQVILIFSGVMGLLGLLSDTREKPAGWRLDLAGGQRVPAEERAYLQLTKEVAAGDRATAQEAVK